MRIGVDIDDVLVDTSKLIREYMTKIDNTGDLFNHMEEIMRGELPDQLLSKFIEDNILGLISKVRLKTNVKEVLDNLTKTNEIIFITARGDERFRGAEAITIEYLKTNNIQYNEIIFNAFDKAKICKDNNIDILIDDSIKLCEEAQEIGIKSILFTSIVNENKTTKVQRVESWKELEKIILYFMG